MDLLLQVYEGEEKTADKCHFLGEFELSGIPPLPKNELKINAIFIIDTNGILSVNASCGKISKAMKLDVYSKSGGMMNKEREQLSSRLKKLMSQDSKNQPKCKILEDATRMTDIPKKQNKSNVLKVHVDSEVNSEIIIVVFLIIPCTDDDGDDHSLERALITPIYQYLPPFFVKLLIPQPFVSIKVVKPLKNDAPKKFHNFSKNPAEINFGKRNVDRPVSY